MKKNTVQIKIKFITIMQKYSGNQREVDVELPADPEKAVENIISQFQIPWKENLEKYVRIFINREILPEFIRNAKQLKTGDTIVFVPFSGGG